MNKLKLFFMSLFFSCNSIGEAQESIYDISILDIYGEIIDLNDFKGKHILFVNVASKCGFTSQYEDLEKLYNKYKEDLVVIGVPCNQFGSQEPGDSKQIISFCERNYNITFLLTEKIHVKGNKQHPLYAWLTKKSLNGRSNSSVKWNFQKYLISPDGVLLDYFYSMTSPLSDKITNYINLK